MILLDTDHFSVLSRIDSPSAASLKARLAEAAEPFGITIVTVVEQFRGWAADINRARDAVREVQVFGRLSQFVDLLRHAGVAPYDLTAAAEFERLRRQKVRIGSMDLNIAADALANNALLLTANRRDFVRVPGLRIENWLGDSSH